MSGTGDYDNVGNILHIEYKHNSQTAQNMYYEYDDFNRLVEFTHNSGTPIDYEYDDNGNLRNFPGKTMTYGSDNNYFKYE